MLNINKLYEVSQRLKLIFIVIAIAIVVVSTLFTNRLAKSLAAEEQKKVEIWAEAAHQSIIADENTDITFISSIIQGNTTIPVILTDTNNVVISSLNIIEPQTDIPEFYTNKNKECLNQRIHLICHLSASSPLWVA